MPEYRLYRLSPESGHITAAEEMVAADDVAAVHEVRQRRFDVPVELWSGKRKVTRIDATPEGAAVAHPPARRELAA